MTPENQKRYDAKLKRINEAIALKEPDRVPVSPPPELFPIFNAGYTVAEVVNDSSLQKMRTATTKYLQDFDPDSCWGSPVGFIMAGEGPGMELVKPKNMRWAGMPGNVIDQNSIHQFIEYPLLLDDEFDEFFKDRTGWIFRKSLPRLTGLAEHLTDFSLDGDFSSGSVRRLASLLSTPASKEMIRSLWAIDEYFSAFPPIIGSMIEEVVEMGFPIPICGLLMVPFDEYSDYLRGTMLASADLYDRPGDIEKYTEARLEVVLDGIKATKGQNDGGHIFMPLHKGMDGFMSDEHYRRFYWSHLQKIILAIIDSGKVPFIYTEGKYNTRLDCLTEVPPGKVFYHFEDVDMAIAKKKMQGVACISGGYPYSLLDWSNPDRVREEVKRYIDMCAPGGGYIFATSCGLGNAKRENVEALFEAVKDFGKY